MRFRENAAATRLRLVCLTRVDSRVRARNCLAYGNFLSSGMRRSRTAAVGITHALTLVARGCNKIARAALFFASRGTEICLKIKMTRVREKPRHFNSLSNSANSLVLKKSMSVIPIPSHNNLIVTMPGLTLLPYRIFLTVDGGTPESIANLWMDSFFSLSSMSSRLRTANKFPYNSVSMQYYSFFTLTEWAIYDTI